MVTASETVKGIMKDNSKKSQSAQSMVTPTGSQPRKSTDFKCRVCFGSHGVKYDIRYACDHCVLWMQN